MGTLRTASPLAALGLLLLAYPAASVAQVFDSDAYDDLARECASLLTDAEQAFEADDLGGTMVFLDMAWDDCSAARQEVTEAYAVFSDRDRVRLFDDLLTREQQAIPLMVGVGDCRGAFNALTVTSALVETLDEQQAESWSELTATVLHCLGPEPGRSVDVQPGQDAHWETGTTIGRQPAASFDSRCTGMLPLVPSFHLHLDRYATVSLSVVTDGDSVLLLGGPTGMVSCADDDGDSYDPFLVTELWPGTYDLYIGEFSASDTGLYYSVEFFADAATPPAGGPPTSLVAPLGDVDSSTGPAVRVPEIRPDVERIELSLATPTISVRGDTHGDTEWLGAPEACAGLFPDIPNYLVAVPPGATVSFELSAESRRAELALAVRNPGRSASCVAEEVPLTLSDDGSGWFEVFVSEVTEPRGRAFWLTTILID